jgi:hypothetical protein
VSQPRGLQEPDVLPQPELEQAICCAVCSQSVTARRHFLEVEGSHERTFRNPAGYSFHVLCFREAPGCRVQGRPTTEASWFAGTAWSFAFCQGCGQHLGWHYGRGEQPAFFGLVAPRLVGWR